MALQEMDVAPPPGTASREYVLMLVEDSPADVRLAQEVFRDAGFRHRLLVARDGEQALRMLRREGEYLPLPQPDLILLDLNLPRRDGREVLREIKQEADPLDEVARRIARRYRLICFDEFHVSDIADAMILERLLHGLFEHGVAFVMTSNYRPDDLYPDGLHRESILPAIALLKAHLDVVNVDAGVDYRRQTMAQVPAYLVPSGAEADARLAAAFAQVAEVADEDPRLRIENRDIVAKRRAGGVVWFDFATLCGGPRSQLDYLEIATRFHTVILSDVSAMNAAMSSEARRFTWMVDVFYDQKVKLLVSAECAAEQLYTTGAMAHEFVRTASRLVEMQSREYLEAPRRGVAEKLV